MRGNQSEAYQECCAFRKEFENIYKTDPHFARMLMESPDAKQTRKEIETAVQKLEKDLQEMKK